MEKKYILVGGRCNGQTITTNGTDRIRFSQTLLDYRGKPVLTYLSPKSLVTYIVEEYRLEKYTLDDGRLMECYRLVDLSDKEVVDVLMDKDQ